MTKQKPEALASTVTIQQLEEAVRNSGYPLQKRVAIKLLESFNVEEEWCFRDKDTNEYRTIDVIVEKYLYLKDLKRIHLSMAIECKQSHLPYVFFINEHPSILPNFPLITGVNHDSIKGKDGYYRHIVNYLKLNTDDFVKTPPNCSTFSKCERKGSKIVLSGSTPYNELVMPLLKSILKLKEISVPPVNKNFLDFSLLLGLGIIDGPMMGVFIKDGIQTIKPIKWVRIIRHEPHEKWGWMYGDNLYCLDLVNIDYLDEYIEKNLLPFSERLVNAVLKNDKALLKGFE